VFARQIREEYDRFRAQHAGHRQKLVGLEQARTNAPKLSFDDLPTPEFVGVRVLSSEDVSQITHHVSRITLSDLVPFIDWSPFFHTWELRGRYPAILNHAKHGEAARKLFADAQQLLQQIVNDRLLIARAVYGSSRPTASVTTWNFTPTKPGRRC